MAGALVLPLKNATLPPTPLAANPPPNSDNVYIMAVNDRFVMKAWGDALDLDSFRNAMRQSKNKIQVRAGSTERHRDDHKHRRHHQHLYHHHCSTVAARVDR